MAGGSAIAASHGASDPSLAVAQSSAFFRDPDGLEGEVLVAK
jgi:hypothetical protein